ncbi:low molecular weight protein-tyrosine-phosphatase [Helicobacter sp.]|uniref:low molecular weight protein-tyrosine-phosphatase n=1 Tax=Helicobacter sp. TaxID=218 RepID=UPI0025BE128F|nr:low molecular weight protein-tyrosine-phosphatase [Helicobacter sp.]MCI5968613.1 low molecular weight phosphotyrosine protein phosphatase [Helicobacter sp.]MDY2584436.1 low molecular weight protein-tyrosine-phosphatase [Helicobacter sp.]
MDRNIGVIQSILFVCLGNICRSPLAEGIARELASKKGLNLKIDSAGTSGWHINEPPCERSIIIGKRHGIDISALRGRKVNAYSDLEFDLVVAMDGQNYADLKRLGFPKEKLALMGDFGLQGKDIPDPYYYKDLDGFEEIYTMLEKAIAELLIQKFRFHI